MKRRVRYLYAALALLSYMAFCTSLAFARGTVRISQDGGSAQRYAGSVIELVGNTIRVFSPDRRDTLIITHAACSYVGEIERCLPYRLTLRRNDTEHAIAFDRGSVYFNPTALTHPLPRSSTRLAPNGVLVFVRTARGTSIAVQGTVDKVTR